MEFPGAEMQALCLAGVGFATGITRTPTNTGLAETTGIAPQARICVPGPGPGNHLDINQLGFLPF